MTTTMLDNEPDSTRSSGDTLNGRRGCGWSPTSTGVRFEHQQWWRRRHGWRRVIRRLDVLAVDGISTSAKTTNCRQSQLSCHVLQPHNSMTATSWCERKLSTQLRRRKRADMHSYMQILARSHDNFRVILAHIQSLCICRLVSVSLTSVN